MSVRSAEWTKVWIPSTLAARTKLMSTLCSRLKEPVFVPHPGPILFHHMAQIARPPPRPDAIWARSFRGEAMTDNGTAHASILDLLTKHYSN